MNSELNIIWILAVGLSLACLFGYIAQRLKLSPILGYLLAGYLFGPHFPGVVADPTISKQLASIGVTLLMFAVGLHFSWRDILSERKAILPGAIILSIIPFIAGFALSVWLGQTTKAGIVVGSTLCVASTVVMVKVLADQDLLHTFQGRVAVAWTIVEDLIAIFILVFLPALSQPLDKGIFFSFFVPILIVVAKIIGLVLLVYIIGEYVIKWLLKYIARTRSHELFTLAILSIVFLIAIGSSYIFGVSIALGAFIAGTVVGKTDVSQQAAANALPMRDAFAVLFFLSIGMLFNPGAIKENLPLFFGVLFIILILRSTLGFAIVKILGYPLPVAATVGIAIAQIGEYSFILVEEGTRLKLLPSNDFDIIVACSLISIALNPILFRIFRPLTTKSLYKVPLQLLPPAPSTVEMEESKEPIQPQAIVVGYGVVGQAAYRTLHHKEYKVLIIDRNVDVIHHLKKSRQEAVFGDAAQPQLMEMTNVEDAQLIVITVPDYKVTKAIIQTVQRLNPYIKIVARVRLKADLKNFEFVDIPIICDEDATADSVSKTILTMIAQEIT